MQPSPEQIVKAKLYTATALIREGNKDAARAVLLTLPNDVNAKNLLQQLGLPQTQPKIQKIFFLRWGLFVAGLVAVSIISSTLAYQQGQHVASITPTAPSTLVAIKTKSPTNQEAPTDAAVTKVASQYGKWELESDTSTIDGTITTYIYVKATKEVQGSFVSQTPALVLRCDNKDFNVYVNTGTQIQETSMGSKEAEIRYRIGNNNVLSITAPVATSGDAIFFNNPITFAKRLIGSDSLAFEFSPYNTIPQDTSFDLRGIELAVKPVFEACLIR